MSMDDWITLVVHGGTVLYLTGWLIAWEIRYRREDARHKPAPLPVARALRRGK